MAFTNIQAGPAGVGLQTVADWTFTQSAAADTIVLQGGRLWGAIISSQDTTGAIQMWTPRVSVSVSGATMTVTIYAQEGVTNGRAVFFHG